MSTLKLYDSLPYTTGFTAKILDIIEDLRNDVFSFYYNVILDRTLFFPESGGQTCDRGKIHLNGRKYDVLHVSINDAGVISHHIVSSSPLNHSFIGNEITGEINWEHRFSNMQQHTGEHIISGLINSMYGFNNVGFHLSDNIVTADYDGFLDKKAISLIENKANEIIYQNIPITCYYPSRENLSQIHYRSKSELTSPVRLVEISGVDLCACCCPHVKQSGEIGLIKITSAIRYKGGSRLTFLCGKRAISYFTYLLQQCTDISQFLSAERDSLMPAVTSLTEERDKLKQLNKEANEKLLDCEVRESLFVNSHPLVFVENYSMSEIRNAVKKLTTETHIYCGIFSGNDEEGYTFVLGSKDLDCTLVNEKLSTLFDAKGGGKKEMIQGFVKGKKNEIIKIIHSLY